MSRWQMNGGISSLLLSMTFLTCSYSVKVGGTGGGGQGWYDGGTGGDSGDVRSLGISKRIKRAWRRDGGL